MAGIATIPSTYTEERLYEKYHAVGMAYGAELLFRYPDALDFIDDCEQTGMTILGLDFYKDVGDRIIPLLNSADYSLLRKQPDSTHASASAARRLVKNGFPDAATWVSFVLEE